MFLAIIKFSCYDQTNKYLNFEVVLMWVIICNGGNGMKKGRVLHQCTCICILQYLSSIVTFVLLLLEHKLNNNQYNLNSVNKETTIL